MMKRLFMLTVLLPFACFAQPFNTMNNPNQPGYQIPSQQRMQTQMQSQQIQQKGMLNQQLRTQTQLQQQHLQTQMNNNQQRIQQGQLHEQTLPNSGGGMLNGGTGQSSGGKMLPQRQNGDMLNRQN